MANVFQLTDCLPNNRVVPGLPVRRQSFGIPQRVLRRTNFAQEQQLPQKFCFTLGALQLFCLGRKLDLELSDSRFSARKSVLKRPIADDLGRRLRFLAFRQLHC